MVSSLKILHCLNIPRTYLPVLLTSASNKSVHIFSDASDRAVAAVGYLVNRSKMEKMTLVSSFGKSNVAPNHGHMTLILELCCEVLAFEIAESIATYLDLHIKDLTSYTDINVIPGYTQNVT